MPNTTIFYSNKGGSGTTVVAAAVAALRSRLAPVRFVSDDGFAALGLPEPADGLTTIEGLTVADDVGLDWWTDDVELIIDAGVIGRDLPANAFSAGQRILVTRCCYLSLRRSLQSPVKPDGVVVLVEPDRALGTREVEDCIGVPVIARIPVDPAIARAVDAGLLATRVPKVMRHGLNTLSRAITAQPSEV